MASAYVFIGESLKVVLYDNGASFNHKNEWNFLTCRTFRTGKHCKLNRADTERQMLFVLCPIMGSKKEHMRL